MLCYKMQFAPLVDCTRRLIVAPSRLLLSGEVRNRREFEKSFVTGGGHEYLSIQQGVAIFHHQLFRCGCKKQREFLAIRHVIERGGDLSFGHKNSIGIVPDLYSGEVEAFDRGENGPTVR